MTHHGSLILMAAKKSKRPKPSAEQKAAAEQQWAELETALEREMLIVPSQREVGRILYHMKRCLKQWGLNKGRRGLWESVLRKHGIPRSTASDWIKLYQAHAQIPKDELVLAPVKKPQQNGQKNTPGSVALPESCSAEIVGADDKNDEEEKPDNSPEGRMPVECVFCLTTEEKHRFMAAVKNLGSLRRREKAPSMREISSRKS